MYKSWDALKIQNESEVLNLDRIRGVFRARSSTGIGLILGYMMSGILCDIVGAYLTVEFWESQNWLKSSGCGFFFILISMGFFYAAQMALMERQSDPVRGFLKESGEFGIVPGEIISADQETGNKWTGDRIHAKCWATTLEGAKLTLEEYFDPGIWPFSSGIDEANLKTRHILPVAAYVLYKKEDHSCAALIGIDKTLIENALTKMNM